MSAASPIEKWTSLRWSDLTKWAGTRSVERGRTYQRQGRVRDLAITADGRLLATVIGTYPYVVTVRRKEARKASNSIQSVCTCPVGESCKHAVATVAAALESIATGDEVERAPDDDLRWAILAGDADDDALVDLDEGEDERDSPARTGSRASRPRGDRGAASEERLRAYLRGKGVEELTEIVLSLTNRLPDARTAMLDEIAAQTGDVQQLLSAARREIKVVTAIVPWRESWSGAGELPDYTRLEHLLEQLAKAGRADDVVSLGRTLLSRGMEQVENSHDEGETAVALGECLRIVFKALKRSSMAPSEQILFVIDALLQDDFGVLDESTHEALEAHRKPADWSKVADALAKRLGPTPGQHAAGAESGTAALPLRDYRRDSLSSWLSDALDRAGRSDQVLDIYEREARATGSYSRLVMHLIEVGRTDDARRWALEGIEKTSEKLPGIASDLAKRLLELARQRRDWPTVAAHAAHGFFSDPSLGTFESLVEAASKAGCMAPVRDAALEFLATGRCPLSEAPGRSGSKAKSASHRWPLPTPDEIALLLRRGPIPNHPHHHVLLDKAIADKTPDEALHWYDRICTASKRSRGGWIPWDSEMAERVAEAVAHAHPDRALAIYEDRLLANLKVADSGAYHAVGCCLQKIRPILKRQGREQEWRERVAGLREEYRRRPRFIEVLDSLENRPIVQTLRLRAARETRR